ncbi:MAG: DNA-directed RNA polymerase subunit omega [Lachnospiraceae bacterium]|nr:DNA-directed RNA polymerase subunit omega [Lachnospiraceae bacterium]
MLHPSYSELMETINSEAEEQETVVNSRYSIVIATAKRARQIIDGDMPLVESEEEIKPLSAAVQELATQKIQILPEDNDEE